MDKSGRDGEMDKVFPYDSQTETTGAWRDRPAAWDLEDENARLCLDGEPHGEHEGCLGWGEGTYR